MNQLNMEESKLGKAFITGHRPDKLFGYNMADERYTVIREWFKEQFIQHNIKEVYCGMALGTDIIGADAVLELKESGTDIKLHACIPFNNYEKRWNSIDVKAYREVVSKSDYVEVVTDAEWEDGCSYLLDRNHFMVDRCCKGFGIVNNNLKPAVLNKTGTMECIKYAKKNEVECIVFDAGELIETQKAVVTDETENEAVSTDEVVKKKAKAKRKPNTISLEALELWNTADRFIVMDLETTGYSFNSGSRIIDIGAYEIQGNMMLSKYEQLVNPGCQIPINIQKLTGINNLMVQRKPSIVQVIDIVNNYVGDKPVIFHNAKFDYGCFIEPMYKTMFNREPNWRVLCTMELARMILTTESKALDKVYEALTGKKASNQSHRASADALMTAEIAVIMQKYVRDNYSKLKENLEIKLGVK